MMEHWKNGRKAARNLILPIFHSSNIPIPYFIAI
jgi:hypothetical protein